MTHRWHDIYHHQQTPAHHLDPRCKLLAGFGFVFLILCTPRLTLLQGTSFTGVLLAAAAWARLSPVALMYRFISLLPFVVMSVFSVWLSHLPLEDLEQMVAKSLLSAAALSMTALTTPFPDMLRALQAWKVPRPLLLFLAFVYRYVAVLGNETVHIERGWQARYYGRDWWGQGSRLGPILAVFFIRSFERAERIYAAMLARGFSSDRIGDHVLHWGWKDALFLSLIAVMTAYIRWGLV